MRILYVCTGNSSRSPIAEALTRKYKPELEVESAGTEPAAEVAENIEELLAQEDALQYLKPTPDPVSQRAVDEADLIVAMEERHRDYLLENFEVSESEVQVWRIEDPVSPDMEPEDVVEEIKGKIKQLQIR